jgi:ankyrin repeat protein
MVAAANGHEEIVGFLLDHGADARAKSKTGVTALTLAVAKGHQSVADLLKRRGGQ